MAPKLWLEDGPPHALHIDDVFAFEWVARRGQPKIVCEVDAEGVVTIYARPPTFAGDAELERR